MPNAAWEEMLNCVSYRMSLKPKSRSEHTRCETLVYLWIIKICIYFGVARRAKRYSVPAV